MSYNQLVCLQGITDDLEYLGRAISKHFDVRVQMADEYVTNPDSTGDGGRRDVLFYVHDDDVQRFAIPMRSVGCRWWEDVLSNLRHHGNICQIPQDVIRKYPASW